jgi:hypothetical protein
MTCTHCAHAFQPLERVYANPLGQRACERCAKREPGQWRLAATMPERRAREAVNKPAYIPYDPKLGGGNKHAYRTRRVVPSDPKPDQPRPAAPVWSEDEMALLRRQAPDCTLAELAMLFPARSMNAIYNVMYRRNIKFQKARNVNV